MCNYRAAASLRLLRFAVASGNGTERNRKVRVSMRTLLGSDFVALASPLPSLHSRSKNFEEEKSDAAAAFKSTPDAREIRGTDDGHATGIE